MSVSPVGYQSPAYAMAGAKYVDVCFASANGYSPIDLTLAYLTKDFRVHSQPHRNAITLSILTGSVHLTDFASQNARKISDSCTWIPRIHSQDPNATLIVPSAGIGPTLPR